MDIRVCCPSYKRPKVETLDYLPFCKIYVDASEYDEYCRLNPHATIIKCCNGIQGNVSRVRNYIHDKEFSSGADVVVIIDDDMKGIYYWENKKQHKIKTEYFLEFIEKYSNLAMDFGAKLWGVNCNKDPQNYRLNQPFSTLSFVGCPFHAFLKGNECRYDERLPLKEDYDMTLQQLNKYRIALRINKFFYDVKQSKQIGGCATVRNLEYEKQQLELLQKKWGKNIVRYDTADRNHRTTKKRTITFDYNPLLYPPIKGV